MSPLFKVYKKVVEFSQQKIFWVLVFSIRIWYLAYPTDRSFTAKNFESGPIKKDAVLSAVGNHTY